MQVSDRDGDHHDSIAVETRSKEHITSSSEEESVESAHPSISANNRRGRGRPKLNIDKESCQILLDLGFTVSSIADRGFLGQRMRKISGSLS